MAVGRHSVLQGRGEGERCAQGGQSSGQGAHPAAAAPFGQPAVTGAKAELALLCPGQVPFYFCSSTAAALHPPHQASTETESIKADATAVVPGRRQAFDVIGCNLKVYTSVLGVLGCAYHHGSESCATW